MSANPFFTHLSQITPPEMMQAVVASLRQDPVIWAGVQELSVEQLSNLSGKGLQGWTPAKLALAVLGCNPVEQDLSSEADQIIEVELLEHAAQICESFLAGDSLPVTLANAGCIALTLRERYSESMDWNAVLDLADLTLNMGDTDTIALWRAALICLYGMAPNAETFLQSFLGSRPSPAITASACNCVLCNPAEDAVRGQALTAPFFNLDPFWQPAFLIELQARGQEGLAQGLAQALVDSNQPGLTDLTDVQSPDEIDPRTWALQANRLQISAIIHQLAGRLEEARALLSQAQTLYQLGLTEIGLQQMGLGDSQDNNGDTFLQPIQLQSMHLQVAAALTCSTSDTERSIPENVMETSLHPLLGLEIASQLYRQADVDQARQLAARSVRGLEDLMNNGSLPISSIPFHWKPAKTIDRLIEMGLPGEALALAENYLRVRPADVDLLRATCKAEEMSGSLADAIETARLIVGLSPLQAEPVKKLIELYELNGAWCEALQEQEQLLQRESTPSISDRINLGRLALRAGALQRAQEVCQELLSSDSDQGHVHLLAGQVYQALDDQETALMHFSRATLLIPEVDQSWLCLAAILRQRSGAQRALETLRAAIQAAPESSALHFALGQACLENGAPSEGLPYLWEAYRLDSDQPDLAEVLSSTLERLGHVNEARQVVEPSRLRWPRHAGLAAMDARLYIAANDLESALPALEIALAGDTPDPHWYGLYAKALLREDSHQGLLNRTDLDLARLESARAALEKATEQLPDGFETRVLLAEVLMQQDENQAANGLYQSLVQRPETAQMQWRWRIQAGLGRSALILNDIDTAVCALREAAVMRPEDIILQQRLSEAYYQANLSEEAAQAARRALQVAPQSLTVLSWYIQMMTGLNRENEMLSALSTASQLAPEQPDIWNRLARLQARRGDNAGSRASLSALLEIASLTLEDLRDAAASYLILGDHPAALSCLEKALELDATDMVILRFETAALRHQLGQTETALELLKPASVASEDYIELRLLEIDLLTALGRSEDARAALENACALLENPASEQTPLVVIDGCLPAGWMENARKAAAVFERLAMNSMMTGRMEEALSVAEKGLQIQPGNLALRCLAVHIARAQIASGKAAHLVRLPDEVVPDSSPDNAYWEQALVSEQVEMALEVGEIAQAARLIESGIPTISEEPHLMAIQARLMTHMGDRRGAQEALQCGLKTFAALSEPKTPLLGPDIEKLYMESGLQSMAEAALDMERWQEAALLFTRNADQFPGNALAQLRLARALVLSAERQQTCAALMCITHAPGEDFLQPVVYQQFQKAIEMAGQLSASPEVVIWKTRGEAVYHPVLKNAPALAKLPASAENAAALISTLRIAKNAGNAVRLMHHYPESPELLLQLALCYHEVDAVKGMEVAQKSVEKAPDQPLNYAALALTAEKVGDGTVALSALEEALIRWPEEAGWQAWAARLYHEAGRDGDAVAHYEKALALQPTGTIHSLALGQIYLNNHDSLHAVEVLEHASRIDPQNQAVWMALAEAYQYAGQMDEAQECTHLACQLAPQDPAPLLMSGKIALQMGKYDLALQQASSARALNPDQPEVVLFLVQVMVQKGSLAEGLNILDKALPDMRASLPIQLERGNLIRRLYGAPAALPVFTDLAQAFPHEASVMSLLAETQAECGDAKSAERSAFAAHHLNPEQPQLNYLLGKLQHGSGQLDQAIHFLSEAIRQSPVEVDPYLELGEAYLERREHVQALRTYQQAIKIAPRDYRPFYRAALVLRDNKDYLGAESMLRRAADLAPEDLNIRRQLGAVVALNLVHNSQEVNSIL